MSFRLVFEDGEDAARVRGAMLVVVSMNPESAWQAPRGNGVVRGRWRMILGFKFEVRRT